MSDINLCLHLKLATNGVIIVPRNCPIVHSAEARAAGGTTTYYFGNMSRPDVSAFDLN